MVQAKRKSPSSAAHHRQSFHSLAILSVGIAIGALATILWQGMQGADEGVGAGITEIIKQTKQQQSTAKSVVSEPNTPATPIKAATTFDFFTVLPEIEVVVPTHESDSSSSLPQTSITDKTTAHETASKVTGKVATKVSDSSTYMLQAGSYKNPADADRLKAELAFQGLVSVIQKVSIQARGDFYRVRLGPYPSYEQMAAADQKLIGQGIQTLRLKISTDR